MAKPRDPQRRHRPSRRDRPRGDRGRIHEEEARRWVARQEARELRGTFSSTIPKVLVVAEKT
jgi:hypothetical protein